MKGGAAWVRCVEGEAVSCAAVLGGVAGAGEGAVCFWGGAAGGGEGVAAVAFCGTSAYQYISSVSPFH